MGVGDGSFVEIMGVGMVSRGNGSFVGDYGSFLGIGISGNENSRFWNEGEYLLRLKDFIKTKYVNSRTCASIRLMF